MVYETEPDMVFRMRRVDYIQLAVCLAFIASLLISILVPLSLYRVDYSSYGLNRFRLTNSMDYSTVYENGNHYLGVNHEMIEFPRTFVYEEITNQQLQVFTKEGLTFSFQCSFQWRPIKSFIPEIHQKFRLSYRQQVINRVIATIKNTATQFTTDEFIQKRDVIDQIITNNIGMAVKELGFEIPKDKFQFAKPLLPSNVQSRFLKSQVQLVRNDEQLLRQTLAYVNQNTELLVQNINNNASKLFSQFTAQADRIENEALYNSQKIVETSKQLALSMLFDRLNISLASTKGMLQQYLIVKNNLDNKVYLGVKPTTTLSV